MSVSRRPRSVLGQRLWEWVQAFLAVSVTLAIIYIAVKVPNDKEQHVRLSSAWFLIIGYYFGRRENGNR